MIRESQHPVTHYCDNLPTVMAYKRLKQGKFSASARIAAFLTTVNSYDVDVVHKSGKDILLTDYISRHPSSCSTKKCQVCEYVKEQVFIGEAIVGKVTASDILEGKYQMPYAQPSAWTTLQKKDPVLSKLYKLIMAGQKPETKRTGGDNTILKSLYNQYTKGSLTISKAGLITNKHHDEAGIPRSQIVIPTNLYPGLAAAIHAKLNHPTKFQMGKLMSRHFYCPSSQKMLEECVDNCHTCIALKPMPETLFHETTTPPSKFGTRYAMDVMKRNGQNLLFIVELLTQFCWIKIVDSEKARDVLQAIIETIGPHIHPEGALIRSDGAPGFQTLRNLAEEEESILSKFNIKLELGQAHHKNKNPCAELIIKEGHQAVNRLENPTVVTPETAVMMARHINLKIRSGGLSSWELFTKRGAEAEISIDKSDQEISDDRTAKRLHTHNPPVEAQETFKAGDLVMIAGDKTKLKPRDTFIVNQVDTRNGDTWAELFKLGEKITKRPQLVKTADLVLLPTGRAAKSKAKLAIKEMVPSQPTYRLRSFCFRLIMCDYGS